MKKSKSISKSEKSKRVIPAELAEAIEKQKTLVKQQEARGNFNTYDHQKLARLEAAANEYK